MRDAATADPPAVRRRDGEATRRSILDAAYLEFSDHGLSGARVDAIAARTGTNVRMIYYYFGSKTGLYTAVLVQAYATMRDAEQRLRLETLEPAAAIEALCGFVFDYHEGNPRYSRLVSIENIHRAEHMAGSDTMQALNRTIMESISGILRRGRDAGAFRADATPWDVHLLMTSFCFFRVANRHTLQAIFGKNTLAARTRRQQRRMVAEAVLGYLRAGR